MKVSNRKKIKQTKNNMDYSEYASTLGKAIGTSYIGIKQQRTFLCFVQESDFPNSLERRKYVAV